MTSALAGFLVVPSFVNAQEIPANRFHLESHAGAFVDAYDASADGNATGIQLGLRLGYDLAERSRLVASAGYAKSGDVTNAAGVEHYFVYDNAWLLTTAGAEYEVVPGPTSASLALEVGAGWRRIDRAGQVGDPPSWKDEYSGLGYGAYPVVVPGLTIRHAVSPRTALVLAARDYVFLAGPVYHSPSFSVGVSLR